MVTTELEKSTVVSLQETPTLERGLPMQVPSRMLFARNTAFGGPEVVKIEEAPVPVPQPNEVLVRVVASTVSAGDCRLRSKNVPLGFGFIMGLLFGFSRPKYFALGTELAGEVVGLGAKVKTLALGDRIVANRGMKLGGHAEYATVAENSPFAKVPPNVSFETAAASVFGGTTALVFLRDKLKLSKGNRLLVIGAGGAVGSAAVQLGKVLGAHVTGVCSAKKVSIVGGLGADRVIDYEAQDWREESEHYDVILDTAGGTDFSNARQRLSATGRIGLVVADLPLTLKSAWVSLFHQQKVVAGPISENSADLNYLMAMCENGQFRPLIGEVFPLQQIERAHQAADSGHKVGSVLLTLAR